MANFQERFNPTTEQKETQKEIPFLSSFTSKISEGFSDLGLIPQKEEEDSFKSRFNPISKEQVEFMNNTSIDLAPNGLKIETKGQNPVFIKEDEFNLDQRALFEDLKMEKEMDESFEKAQISKQKTGAGTIPVYGSIDIFARGMVGGWYSTGKAAEKRTEQWENIEDLRIEMGAMIREKAREGDKEGAMALLKTLEMTTDDIEGITTSLVEDAWAETPTRLQVAGAGLELAALAVGGYGSQYGKAGIKGVKPLTKVTKMPKILQGATTSQKILQKAKQYGLSSLRAGTELSIWSAAGEMKVADASIEDIIGAAEKGFKYGAVLGPALHSVGDLSAYGLSRFIPKVKNFTTKTTKKLENIAKGTEKVPITPLEKSLQGIKKPTTASQKAALTALKGVDFIKKSKQRFLDAAVTMERIEDHILAVTKRPLSGKEGRKLYRDTRMVNAWADGLSEKKINHFKNSFQKYSPEVQEYATGYLNLLNSLDRAKMGLKVPMNKTVRQLKREIGELAVAAGDDVMKQVGQIRKTVNKYTQGELTGMVRAGLIDEKQMFAMMKAHPNYMPNKVIMDNIADNVKTVGGSMNVSKTSLNKALGSIKKIDNPIEAMLQRTIITNRVKEKNKLLQNLIKAQKDYKAIPGATKLKSSAKAKKVDMIEGLSDDISIAKAEGKTFDEFMKKNDLIYQGVGKGKQSDFLTTNISEANAYATQKGLKGTGEIKVYNWKDLPNYMKTITKQDESYDLVLKELGKNFIDTPLTKQQFSKIQTAIGFEKSKIAKMPLIGTIKTKSQLKQLWDKGITRAPTKVKDGFEVINFFENGVKQRWQVPNTIAATIKSTDTPISPNWWKTITAPTRALKKGATTYNPGFILTNKSRDVQQAALVSSPFIKETAKRYGFSPKNAKNYSRKEISEMYKQGGFRGASIFEDGEDIMMNTMTKGKVSRTFRYDNVKSVNPLTAIRKTNDMVEQSTRKEVLAKALGSGLSRKDAIWVSRNTPLDYSKMGTWMRPVNEAIPFLNARVQGLAKIPEAFLQQPERFSEAVMNTAVLPTLLLHQHNRRYESYKYINQGIKNSNWVIMTGEVPAISPYTGDEILVPQFIEIRRGEGQSLVSGPIGHWLEKEDGIDSRNVSQMLADTLGSNSPVDFGTYSRSQQNIWGSVAAQFGPIPTMVVGGATGQHPYWGSDIVPEYRQDLHQELQFKGGTAEFLKDIPKGFYRSGFAETFNVSPAMLEFYVSVFGGMPQDVIKATDIAYGVIRDDKMGGLNVTDTTFETLTEIPVIKGFLNQSTYNITEGDQHLISEVERNLASNDRVLKDRADEIIHKIRTLKTPEERKNYFNLLGDELTLDLITEISNRSDTKMIVEGLSKTDRIDVRASVIQIKVQDMKKKGHSEEVIKEFLLENVEAKILTTKVMNEIIEQNK